MLLHVLHRRGILLFLSFALRSRSAASFHVASPSVCGFGTNARRTCSTHKATSTSTTATSTSPNTDYSSLRVSEIKNELRQRGVDFSDCFDKESLVEKLRQNESVEVKQPQQTSNTQQSSSQQTATATRTTPPSDVFDGDHDDDDDDDDDDSTIITAVRAMSVKALREELAHRRMRWADYIDKDDLVQAVVRARKEAARFSASGVLRPGHVSDLTEAQVQMEVEDTTRSAPILLDVYATWCGPCQLMVKELNAAASEWGDTVRVAKMDSDKYPALSGQYRVQGLPTLLLFENGVEIARVEGALQKDQLVAWVQEKRKQ